MITVLQQPNAIVFSRNDIVFKLQTNTPLSTPGLVVEICVFFQRTDQPLVEKILQVALTPDQRGVVMLNLKKVLDNQLEYHLPLQNAVRAAKKQSGSYFIQYRETNFNIRVNDTIPAWMPSGSPMFEVIKGGLPNQLWIGAANSGFFYNYVHPHRLMMTWKKSGQLIGIDERHYLTYYHQEPTTLNGNSGFNFTIYYTDGTSNNSFSLMPMNNEFEHNTFYHIPVGVFPLNLHTIEPNKKILSYTVHPVLNGSVWGTEPYRFVIDYRNFYNKQTIHYFSSIGGFETVRIIGELDVNVKRSSAIADVAKETNVYSSLVKPQLRTVSTSEEVIFKGNVGFEEDPQRQDVLRDVLLSRNHYQYYENRWLPVIILNEETPLGLRSSSPFEFEIEWKLAVVNENYAPGVKAPGEIVYPPDILPPNMVLPDAYSGYDYSYAYQIAGSGDYSITIIDKPLWMNISIVDNTLFIVGKPVEKDVADFVTVNIAVSDNILSMYISLNTTINILLMPVISIENTTITGLKKNTLYQIGEAKAPNTPLGQMRFVYSAYGHEVTYISSNGETLASITANIESAINNTTVNEWEEFEPLPPMGRPSANVNFLCANCIDVDTSVSAKTLFQVLPL